MSVFIPRCWPVVLLSLSLSCTKQTNPQAAGSLRFEQQGTAIRNLTLAQLQSLVGTEVLEVFEYQNGQPQRYRVMSMQKTLDHVYGPGWRSMHALQLSCRDGYKPIVPVAELLRFSSYLAFARADDKPFQVVSQLHQGHLIELGPFELVWDNLHDTELRAQGANFWPFQVEGMDLIAHPNPAFAPPPNSSATVMEGYQLFQKSCIGCHKMNGFGGESPGIELNRPVSVTRYFQREFLLRWIDNSQAIRASSRMPSYQGEAAFGVAKHERMRQIEAIVQYLEAMAQASE